MHARHKLNIIFSGLCVIIFLMAFLTWWSTTQQESDGLVINLAGRQRMLAQKMTKDLFYYQIQRKRTGREMPELAEEIRNTMKIFNITILSLKNSGPVPLSLDLKNTQYRECPVAPEPAYTQLGRVIKLWEEFSSHFEAVLENQDVSELHLNFIMQENKPLVEELNKAVIMLQEHSEAKLRKMLIYQVIGIIIGICLIIVAAITFIKLQRAEKQREQTLARQKYLNLLQQDLLGQGPLKQQLKRITDGAVKAFDADFCRIWVIRPGDLCESGCIHATATEGPDVCRHREHCLHLLASSGRYTHTDGKVHRRVPFGYYKIGRLATDQERKIVTNDVTRDPRVQNHEWAKKLGLVSFAGYQLCPTGGNTIGVLALFARHPISPADDAMLETLSNTAVQVIQTAGASKELRESEKRFSSVVNTANEAIISLDSNSKIIFWNAAAHKMFGYSAAEAMGQDIVMIMPERFRQAHSQGIKKFTSTKKPKIVGSALEVVGLKKDGVEFPVTLSLSSWEIRDAVFFTGIISDISKRKRAEEALLKSNRTLEEMHRQLKEKQAILIQSEKMAGLGQIAAGIAHEINNPVGFVNSNLGTLAEYVGTFKKLLTRYETLNSTLQSGKDHRDKEVQEILARIEEIIQSDDLSFILEDIDSLLEESSQGTQRVKEIVQNLKSFARVDEAESKEADINEGIEATLKVVWNELKYKTQVHKKLNPLPLIRCYPGQLNQVFMNLLVNAAQAIPQKGEITVETEATDTEIIIRISDTGEGIPKEVLSKLFDPFFTTKAAGKGTGLGLSISYGIIKKHKGRIDVESEVGKGTTFTIRLPLEAS